jgi:calcineurin-like phosphoesterase family protein/biotin operon repressor
MPSWKLSDLELARTLLGQYSRSRMHMALTKLGRKLERDVTEEDLNKGLLKKGMPAAALLCLPDQLPSDIEKLVKLTRKTPPSFEALCDKLNLSPKKARDLIEKARAQGVQIHVENNHVGIKGWYEDKVHTLSPAPLAGARKMVAVISDIHLGSKYCLRSALRDFVEHAYAQGVREVLCPGDVLDGMYKHGVFEVSRVGIADQAEDLREVLPELPGLTYHMITGNHDFTFTEASGVDVGAYLVNHFVQKGRKDLFCYGDRGAFLRIHGAVVHLWHPRSGTSYARSYALQKHVEKYTSAEKPHILLAGHWHIYCHVYEREVHAIACPTFQGGGSAFSKSLGGAPAIGGLILSWQMTKAGTIRSFGIQVHSYPEREVVQTVRKGDA